MTCKFSNVVSQVECSDDTVSLSNCSENDIIIVLTECGIFPNHISNTVYDICSRHFSHLLERNANRRKRVYCEIPPLASTHPDTTTSDITKFRSKNTRKKERQLTFANVVTIRNKIGIVIPVGTSVCANCRRSICSPVPEEKIDNEEEKEISCTAFLNEKDNHRRNVNTYNSKSFYNDDPMQEMFETDSFPSTCEQADLSQQSSQNSYECCGKLESLNHFLSLCGVANVNIPVYTWASYTDKTKKGYIQKIKEVVQAVVDTLFRNETEVVLQDVYSSVNGCNIQPAETETDCIIVDALTESYSKAESWQLKRQILSVLSKTLSFQGMSQKIPGITEYRYYIAKKHSAVYGCALPPPITEHHRQKMDPHKLDSFLDFITSSHIIKDLPFGERKMRLSSGKIIETPNVIRCMAPAAIIQQFKQYCAENEEIPLGDSTMFKILTECTANVRKAFEGIDYFIAEGGRAFQDICNVVQELCQVGALTDQRAKDYADIVQECKRYLKTDFKSVCPNDAAMN